MQGVQGTKAGLNPDTGFPLVFTEFAEELGWYIGYEEAAGSIAERYPVSRYPRVLEYVAILAILHLFWWVFAFKGLI